MSNRIDRLTELREQIDVIDQQLQDLLNQRAQLALQVGRTKLQATQQEIVFYDPEREQAIIEKIVKQQQGPLSKQAIQSIFKLIMQQCLLLQKKIDQ